VSSRALRVCAPFAAVLLASLPSGCTTGQANTTPPISSGGGSAGLALQLSVGTANFEGTPGLVVLETFRDAQGYTAIPITTATLRGPAGLVAPSGSKDPGSGTHAAIPIGSASNQFVIGTGIDPPKTRLAGADGWGIGPPSCSCPGINFYPFQPQFADAVLSLLFPGGPQPFYGGPPAYPPATLVPSALSQLVSIPSGWAEGFYLIGLRSRAPSGGYSIEVSYRQNGALRSRTAHAVLHASHVLPRLQPLTMRSDGKGGLIVALALPLGVRQALVNVIDSQAPPAYRSGAAPCPTGLGFATLLFTASGTQRIPDDLGNYGQGGAPTFCKGDLLEAQAFGFDYDDFGLGPPVNAQQRPRLPPQADMTIGYPAVGVE
jgi:hypothetical protein